MATRLYPRTENVSVLEQLASVPAGTHERLMAFDRLPAEFFGRPENLAHLAVAQKAKWDADPQARKMSLQGHYQEVRKDFRCDPEYTRFLYREYVALDEAKLRGFLDSGWGRLQAADHWLESNGFDYNCGAAFDKAQVLGILEYQAIDDRLEVSVVNGENVVRTMFYTGIPKVTYRGASNYPTRSEFVGGPWVPVTALEGVCWS